ncbi:coiled-coil domain-containing protein 108 [Elysia marginata]|uniref:Coiled-coil domain-containing protein 108 n=1 Tax=Elysia marginata TaxID=1093978 RepID=A0AAV4G1R5_9GAST|nr:coiled-coil domain-containing protein 108 [Elysia marginata]
MPNKCGVVNCKGNYDSAHKCRVFRLPKNVHDQQKWLNVLPPREGFVIDPSQFFICEKHWPAETQMIKIPGASTRPVSPPSIFDVPLSCLLTPKPAPRQPKVEDKQLNFFLQKDNIKSFIEFQPGKELTKMYENIVISRTVDKFVCIFMENDFCASYLTIIVHNKSTLCSPLTFYAFKNGVSVPLGKILSPNNGLQYYSQFMEAVHSARNYSIPVDVAVKKITLSLQKVLDLEDPDSCKTKKLTFLTRQLHLTYDKNFSVNDY